MNDKLNEKTNLVSETMTVKIPSDFGTIQSALNHIKQYHLGNTVIVMIESGYEINESTTLSDTNFNTVRLRSEDSIVKVTNGLPTSYKLFDFNNVFGFHFELLIDMQGHGTDGIYLRGGSKIRIQGKCGVINAGDDGLSVRD